MICPFCQAELNTSSLSCPRCGAAYPGARGGAAGGLGLRLRMFGVAFVVLVIASLILVDCVLRRLPSDQVRPDRHSTVVQRELLMMQQHQQGTQNAPLPPPLH